VVKWIVVAVLVVALLVLALAVRPVLTRLPALDRAARRLQGRQAEAESLQAAAAGLEERLAALRESSETTARRLELIRAKRGEAERAE
jgi:hypothetical protein